MTIAYMYKRLCTLTHLVFFQVDLIFACYLYAQKINEDHSKKKQKNKQVYILNIGPQIFFWLGLVVFVWSNEVLWIRI